MLIRVKQSVDVLCSLSVLPKYDPRARGEARVIECGICDVLSTQRCQQNVVRREAVTVLLQ
jgi:hypothetical protein